MNKPVGHVSVAKPPTGYQTDRYLTPANPATCGCRRSRLQGRVPSYDLQDYFNCGAAFHSHYNGHCPK
jgi:hypothetical protein